MLQIDRLSLRDHEIPVRLGSHGRRMTAETWKGFGIALTLHLLGLLLFEIKQPEITHYDQPITIIVDAEVPVTQVAHQDIWLPEADISGKRLNSPQFATAAVPELPSAVKQPAERMFKVGRQQNLSTRQFSAIEHVSYTPEKIKFPLHNGLDPLTIEISGPLARFDYQSNLLEQVNRLLKKRAGLDSIRLSYRVKLDEQEGKIFWTEPSGNVTNKSLDQLARQLIDQLSFPASSTGFVVEGEITFTFSLDETTGASELASMLKAMSGSAGVTALAPGKGDEEVSE